jgi:hypothetical protein
MKIPVIRCTYDVRWVNLAYDVMNISLKHTGILITALPDTDFWESKRWGKVSSSYFVSLF